ncbi:Selenoprotein N [Bagarius yarrelli]|uniref:Selenoprotein N n=1 Tax=Bagarius yarrelli TaxID=175774 RepID=A0A556V2X7_BAGYA|nr:Selenoprotein N [Bagarius yarrelli]
MAEDVDKTALLEEKKQQKKKKKNDDDEEEEKKSVNNHESGKNGESRRIWAFWTFFMIVCVPVIGAGIQYVRNTQLSARHEAALKTLGAEGLFLFSSLDTDHDLHLSPEEFKPIAEKLTGVAPPAEFEEEFIADPNGETLTVHATMQPLLLETMTKSKDGFLGVSHSALNGLRSWKRPDVPSSTFSANQFRIFLPPKGKGEPGDTWWIIPSELNIFTGYLPNNRYHPPTARGKEVLIHTLLSMFHPRPFIKSRFAPQGAVACVRAVSDFYYDIVFRIHAEFQLNDVPDFPFWFTPGQFAGHVVLSKDASHVRDFHLYVPNDKSLNVDMEWLYGTSESSNMEVDIGYLPQMELRASGPSTPSVIYDEQGNVMDSREEGGEPIHFVFEEIHWISEISRDDAAGRIEVTFYPFKKVEYLPFPEAFSRAETEGKLADEENLGLSQKARLHLEQYSFPVEMMVVLPNGTVVHHINANNFLDQTSIKPEAESESGFGFTGGFEDPSTSTYIHFLQEGLEKAKAYL